MILQGSTESVVEQAALTWLESIGCAIKQGTELAELSRR